MIWGRIVRIILAFGLALAVSGSIYAYNLRNVQFERMNGALRLARGFASLVEQFTPRVQLPPQNSNSALKESLESSIRLVTHGVDPGWIEIEVITDDTLQEGAERYLLNKFDWTFDYYKNIEDSENLLLKIKIHVGFLGLFGTKVPWMSDVIGVILFIVFFVALLVLMGIFSEKQSDDQNARHFTESSESASNSSIAPDLFIAAPENSNQIKSLLLKTAKEVKALSDFTEAFIQETNSTSSHKDEVRSSVTRLMAIMKELVELLKDRKKEVEKERAFLKITSLSHLGTIDDSHSSGPILSQNISLKIK